MFFGGTRYRFFEGNNGIPENMVILPQQEVQSAALSKKTPSPTKFSCDLIEFRIGFSSFAFFSFFNFVLLELEKILFSKALFINFTGSLG